MTCGSRRIRVGRGDAGRSGNQLVASRGAIHDDVV